MSQSLSQRQQQEHVRQGTAGAAFPAGPLLFGEAGTGLAIQSTQGCRGRILPRLTALPHLGGNSRPARRSAAHLPLSVLKGLPEPKPQNRRRQAPETAGLPSCQAVKACRLLHVKWLHAPALQEPTGQRAAGGRRCGLSRGPPARPPAGSRPGPALR